MPKYLKTVLKLLVTLAALYLVFSKVALQEVKTLVAHAHWDWLLLALLLFAVSKAIAAVRLKLFLRETGVIVSHAYNFRLYLLGMYYNLFLPGGIGGDGYKVYVLNKQFSVKIKTLISALLIDRVSGMVAVSILAALCALMIPFFQDFIWLIVAAIPLGIAAYYFVLRQFFKALVGVFPITTLQSIAVQGSQLVCAWCILNGLGNEGLVLPYLFAFLVSSIVAAFPITIGGVGARELTFYYCSQWLGLEVNQAITLSLLFYVITALVSLTGIYYSFDNRKLQLEQSGQENT